MLKMRFELNMARIATLVQLAHVNRAVHSKGFFEVEGAPAEVLRAAIVLLHATFEVAMRSYVPKGGRTLTFSGAVDLDKALKGSGLDPTPFKALYPALVQMAKRRNLIAHQADLSNPMDTTPESWNISDEWQLTLWLMAVPAFYYKMRMALGIADDDEKKRYDWNMTAMVNHREFAHQLLDFPQLPPERRIDALKRIVSTLNRTVSILKGEVP